MMERIIKSFRRKRFVVLREILGGGDGVVIRRVERTIKVFKRMRFEVLREILGGDMEKLTEEWRDL